MVLKLLYPLVKYFTVFNVFQYITFRAAYAALTALVFSLLVGPWMIRRLQELKTGESIRVDVPERHLSKTGTPTMGGILIILAILLSVLLWQDWNNYYTWILLGATLGFGVIGFVDDYLKVFKKKQRGLRAGLKFSGQTLVSLAVVLLLFHFRNEHTTLLYVPFLKTPIVDLSYWNIPFAV